MRAPQATGGRRREREKPRERSPQALGPRRFRYLDVVVLGAGHHQVVLAGGLGDRQAHHRADVAGQLASGLEPMVGEAQPGPGGSGGPQVGEGSALG